MFMFDLDMLGDTSTNVHMQYLREGILSNENDENRLVQSGLNKV